MSEVKPPPDPPLTPMVFAVVLTPESRAHITEAQARHAIPDLQAQLDRHVAPEWSIAPPRFVSNVFASIAECPKHCAAIVLMPALPVPNALGYHDESGPNGEPCEYVETAGQSVDGITVTMSHECIERALDGACNVYAQGVGDPPREIAQELGDPCEDVTYRMHGGTLVSDFVLPRYFDPMAKPGERVTFCNSLPGPGTRTDGGYLILGSGDTDPPMDRANARHQRKLHQTSRLSRRRRAQGARP